VVPAGTATSTIARCRASALGLAADVVIVAGTTDGCAAFLAAGAERCGDAVTSLGTTLVLKLLSDRPLFDSRLGVYSHRTENLWLVGGASNSGGAAIAKHFCLDRIRELSEKMTPNVPTGLHYYPLAGRGERFPHNNPDMEEQLEPRPESDILFLQALMEGVTSVEKLGYDCLTELGGPFVKSIRTVGGGAKNAAWRTIRARMLGIPLIDPGDDEAAVGTARLARRGLIFDGQL
jgi:D-ribulokinase